MGQTTLNAVSLCSIFSAVLTLAELFPPLCCINGVSSPEDSRKAGTKTPQNGSWHDSSPPHTHLMKPPEAVPLPQPLHQATGAAISQGTGKCPGSTRCQGGGLVRGRSPAQLPFSGFKGPRPHLGGLGERTFPGPTVPPRTLIGVSGRGPGNLHFNQLPSTFTPR